MKIYGNLNNRFDENKNYTGREIREGDDITMYMWSDRHCYFVTKVIDQKHIFVHEYSVCADHSKEGGQGHQNWLYFKTINEMNHYLNSLPKFKDMQSDENIKEPSDIEIVFNRGAWRRVHKYDLAKYEKAKQKSIEQSKNGTFDDTLFRYYFDMGRLTEREMQRVLDGKTVTKYSEFGNISFGVRDYYYDWEF